MELLEDRKFKLAEQVETSTIHLTTSSLNCIFTTQHAGFAFNAGATECKREQN